jgi:Raf kinase inhibitor-like YbhB/YbcL family protein
MAFHITSRSFQEGEVIPEQFTCDGANTPPPLAFADAPAGTRSFALIMDDPDAPNGVFTHWLAYNIPIEGPDLRVDEGVMMRNGFGSMGYGGPCPPHGHGQHRYFFTLYGLSVPALTVPGDARAQLENALRPHLLGTARLMGRYERKGKRE